MSIDLEKVDRLADEYEALKMKRDELMSLGSQLSEQQIAEVAQCNTELDQLFTLIYDATRE